MADIIVADNTPMDIDPNEVLREYGLEDVEASAEVIQQQDGSAVVIPVSESNAAHTAEIIGTTTASSDAVVSDMLNSLDTIMNASGTAIANEAWNGYHPSTDVSQDINDENENNNSEEEAEEVPVIPEETPVPPFDEMPVVVEEPTKEVPKLSTEELLELLPENSKSLMIDESTSRFSGAVWYKAIMSSTVVLAGLGGIGSYVLFCLSRMKPRQLFIYDDDVVELANLSGQLYSSSMVGKRKVDAMADLARDFSMYYGVQAIPERFTDITPAGDVMICGFDNMKARKDFFNAWLNHVKNHPNPKNCLYIDGRLNIEEFQVFCIKGDDSYNIKRYANEYLFEDYQALGVECSMKQTTYCANMIGSVMVNLFINFVANQQNSVIERDLPFKTYYDAGMMYFKTEV